MNKKILTLTLLSTLFAMQPQGVLAAEKPMTSAQRMKFLMAGGNLNQAPVVQHPPLPNLAQQAIPNPLPQLVQGAPVLHPVLPQHGQPVPFVQPLVQPLVQQPLLPGQVLGPIVPVNHQQELLDLIHRFKADANTPAEVTGPFGQTLQGQAGVDIYTQLIGMRTQRNDAQRDLQAANLRVQQAEQRALQAEQRLHLLGDGRLEAVLGRLLVAGDNERDARLTQRLGRAAVNADHVEDARLALVLGHNPNAGEYAEDARLALVLGHNPNAGEYAEDARLALVLGHNPNAGEYAEDARLALVLGHNPNAAEYAADARITAAIGHNPNAGEYAEDARLALVLGHNPNAGEYAEDARLALVLGHNPNAGEYAEDARLALVLGHNPSAAEYAEDARLALVLGHNPNAAEYAADARITAAIGHHPNAGEYAEDARLALVLGHNPNAGEYAEDARLALVLGHNPNAGEYAEDARLALVLGHNPSAAEYAEDARLALVLGHNPNAAEYAADARITAAIGHHPNAGEYAEDARLALVLGHNPNAGEYAEDARLALVLGHNPNAGEYAEDARLALVLGHNPSAAEYAEDARLALVLGHNPNAAEYAADARITAAIGHHPNAAEYVEDARLAVVLGHNPNAAEYAEDARLSVVLGHNPNAAEYIEDARLRVVYGRIPTVADYATDVELTTLVGRQTTHADYVLWDTDLNGVLPARAAREVEVAEGIRIQNLINVAAGGAGRLPTALEIAEGLNLGNNAELAEITEGLRLWNGGAGFEANYEQVVASNFLAHQAREAARAAALALAQDGDAAANGVLPLNVTLEQLVETNRLMNDEDMAAHGASINHTAVQESLRYKGLAAVNHVANPFAGGLTAGEFVEAARLRALNPGGALTARHLQEALRLKAFLPNGASLRQIDTSFQLTRSIQSGRMTWTVENGLQLSVARGPLFTNPPLRIVDAAVILRIKQDGAGGEAIAQPSPQQVLAVANDALSLEMQTALAKAIQNPIAGAGAEGIPYGIAQVTNAPGGHFELLFVKLTDAALPVQVVGNLYSTARGFDQPVQADDARDGMRVGVGALPMGTAVDDIVVFSAMANDAVYNVGPQLDAKHVLLTNATKMN